MPDYVVRRLVVGLNRRKLAVNGQRVLLLGLSYKRNTGDARESPSRRSPASSSSSGGGAGGRSARAPDLVPDGVTLVDATADLAASCAAVVVLVDHDAFDLAALIADAPYVLDTRHCVEGDHRRVPLIRPLPRGRMRADQNELTIRRIKRGKYYSFVRANGTPVRHTGTINVCIRWRAPGLCRSSLLPDPTSHLQAVGRDAAGRLQYAITRIGKRFANSAKRTGWRGWSQPCRRYAATSRCICRATSRHGNSRWQR